MRSWRRRGLGLVALLVLLASAPARAQVEPGGGGGSGGDATLTSPVEGDYVWTGKGTWGAAEDAADSVRLGDTAGKILFEGATADGFETTISVADPTADVEFVWPALSAGTYAPAILDAAGRLVTNGATPTLSSCGTSPTVVTGDNTAGSFTTGTGGVLQACTLTFTAAWAAKPSCYCNNATSILVVRAVATTTTLVCDTAVAGTLASQEINYVCMLGQ